MEARKARMGSVLAALVFLVLISVGQAVPITYMDATLHNGALTFATTGFWYNTPSAIPAGWVETSPNCYSSAPGGVFGAVQTGTYGTATNNTGEVVPAYHAFTVSADLGGWQGTVARVKVYATQNADGSGNKIFLAEVSRPGNGEVERYAMFNVTGTPGYTTPPSLAGYYVQVVLYVQGFYDNIVVTSELSSAPPTYVYMDEILRNGGMTGTYGDWGVAVPPGGWESTDDPNTYTSGGDMFSQHTLFDSPVEAVTNNTGETVQANHRFTIQAALTGDTTAICQASVYATENANGSGNKVLLAQVSRPGNDAVVDRRFTKSSTPSAPTSSSVAGYYIQVHLKTLSPTGDPNATGHYDNITVSSQEMIPNVYMDATLHNGSLAASSWTISYNAWTPVSGYWATEPDAIPWGGWSAADPNRVNTTAKNIGGTTTVTGPIQFDSPAGAVTNNTQESVLSGQAFTVQADLGGMTGATAEVFVYATENADGTGDTVLLADVSRAGNDADGTGLFTVSATGSLIGAEYSGYYVQVVLVTTGATDKLGFYDNIIVTSSEPSAPSCRDQFDAATQAYYDRYVTEPVAWCWQFQCKGDADNGTESVFIEGDYRIYDADLTLLVNNWKGTPEGGANPAADFDHREEAVFIEGSYAIYDGDLTILVNNWKKTDGELSNCPSYLP